MGGIVSRNKPGRQARVNRAASIAEIERTVAEVAKSVPQIQQALEEVAEDNMALTRAIKSVTDHQDSLRTEMCREIDRLRTDVASELLAQTLKQYCRELSPSVSALDRILATGDLSDAVTTRQHLESLATTLQAALLRMGIERIAIEAGRDLFDSKWHDCVHTCTAENSSFHGAVNGVVVFVQEPGYTVRGKLAQPAKVWVYKEQEQSATEAEKDTTCDITK